MRIDRFVKQFNWRFLLVRVLMNALALAITAAILPRIYFVDKSIGNWLLMALMLGVLNALLKPVLQFLTLQFIFHLRPGDRARQCTAAVAASAPFPQPIRGRQPLMVVGRRPGPGTAQLFP